MNPDRTKFYYDPVPEHPEALSFWERGRVLLAEAEQYRRTDWKKFLALIDKGIRLQSSAMQLDGALRLAA